MSVRNGERGEGKLQVLNSMRLLTEYTVGICKNEKYFPKSLRWMITSNIVNHCLEAHACIRIANSIFVENETDAELRKNKKKEAYGHLEALLTLVDVSQSTAHLTDRQIEHWTGLVLDVEKLLKAWTRKE